MQPHINIPAGVESFCLQLREASIQYRIFGRCVTESMLGLHVRKWNIVANTTYGGLKELFVGRNSAQYLNGTALFRRSSTLMGVTLTRTFDPKRLRDLALDHARYRPFGLFYDPENQSYSDPVEAQAAIEERLFDTIADPEWLYRLKPVFIFETIRAVGHLHRAGFTLTEKCWHAMTTNAHLLLRESPQVIGNELKQLAGIRPDFGQAFELLRRLGILSDLIPTLGDKVDEVRWNEAIHAVDQINTGDTEILSLVTFLFLASRPDQDVQSIVELLRSWFPERSHRRRLEAVLRRGA